MSPYRQRARKPRDRGKRETSFIHSYVSCNQCQQAVSPGFDGSMVRPYHVK